MKGMFRYYIELAIRALMHSKTLTTLIVVAIGLGIGASMTMITVLHVMSSDPIPNLTSRLFFPHLEPASLGFGSADSDPGKNLTWVDAKNLLDAHRAKYQATMVGGRVAVSGGNAQHSFYTVGRFTSSEFFEMFNAPFSQGLAWREADDVNRTPVVVLNGELARRLFGEGTVIGKVVRLNNNDFRIVGVLNNWHPEPLFYSGLVGDYAFKSKDDFFIPIATAMDLKFQTVGYQSCWGSGGKMSDQCTWLQFWIELDNSDQVSSYASFLHGYWQSQKAYGRFPQNIPPTLQGVKQRLHEMQLIPSQVHLQLFLAVGFLGICLFNIGGLLLAKFLYRSPEISIRRAMGATKRDIFMQLSVEAVVVGTAGGFLGLALTELGLSLIRRQPSNYAKLVHLDVQMTCTTLAMAALLSLFTAVMPAWRACRIHPSILLKSQ